MKRRISFFLREAYGKLQPEDFFYLDETRTNWISSVLVYQATVPTREADRILRNVACAQYEKLSHSQVNKKLLFIGDEKLIKKWDALLSTLLEASGPQS